MGPLANVRRQYRAASQTPRIARGRDWYPCMREVLDDSRGDAYSLEQACAVFAITSQGAQLKSNLDWTRRALEDNDCNVGRFPTTQAPKIAAVLENDGEAREQCAGPKISAFFDAVSGDPDALVLDRWALFGALGEEYDRDAGPSVAQRKAVERAYRRVARETGEEVRALQAIVWLQVRETTAHGRHGRPVALWDITL